MPGPWFPSPRHNLPHSDTGRPGARWHRRPGAWHRHSTAQPPRSYDTETANDGTYYIEGFAKVGKNVGTAGSPWNVTIIAAPLVGGDVEKVGNILISASPYMRPHLSQTALVAGRDINLSGSPTMNYANGVIAAGEQIDVNGNPSIMGAIVAQNAGAVSPGRRCQPRALPGADAPVPRPPGPCSKWASSRSYGTVHSPSRLRSYCRLTPSVSGAPAQRQESSTALVGASAGR